MRRFILTIIIGMTSLVLQQGCHDDAPPPRRVPVPTASSRDSLLEREFVKPLPPQDWREVRSYTPASTHPS